MASNDQSDTPGRENRDSSEMTALSGFDGIVLMDDREIQRILENVDSKVLALALKGAATTFSEKIFKNMSSRGSEMIKEDMGFMGPVLLKEVQEAQLRIANIVKRFKESREMFVSPAPNLSESKTLVHQHHPITLYIDPGDADAKDIADLYSALNELYQHFGGSQLRFVSNGAKVLASEEEYA